MQEVDKFKVDEAQKKVEKLEKNKAHLALVQRQAQEPPRMFAKTGVAIVKNTGHPQLPV